MRLALAQARLALAHDEIPIGAIVVKDGEILARCHNLRQANSDVSAHAEILALRQAGARLGDWRLNGCTLYVTLEPCAMCAGAIVQSRIEKLVFGAFDAKNGCAGSVNCLTGDATLGTPVDTVGGVLSAECAEILSQYLANKRYEDV